MKNNIALLIASLILIGGGYMIYKKVSTGKTISKEQAVGIIVSSKSHADAAFVSTMESGYVKAWAKAVVSGSASFTYKGKDYRTQGGTSIKK